MNHDKTGALIAKRRRDLGLTQKALADGLNISDRAVSKWERGLGFPDISLIEPLADALGLTVVELLHGQENPPTPEEERSARITLNSIRWEVHDLMKQNAYKIVLLTGLLLMAAVVLVLTISSSEVFGRSEAVTVAQATAASDYALITREEFDLMETLYQDEEICAHFTYRPFPSYNQDTMTSEELSVAKAAYDAENPGSQTVMMDEKFCSQYFARVILPVRKLDYFQISVGNDCVWVNYGTEHVSCSLSIGRDETVQKTTVEYEDPVLDEGGEPILSGYDSTLYRVISDNNETFRLAVRKTGLSALLG